MRMHLLIASVAILALAVAPAMAGPWLGGYVGGGLGEWGLNPGAGDWTANIPAGSALLGSFVEDDVTTAGGSSGGEWYDIEALYCTIEIDGAGDQWLSWALITSYSGRENDSGAASLRNTGVGTDGSSTNPYPYRRHPVLAFDVNGGTTWQYGIVMSQLADGWTGTGSSWSWGGASASHPLTDTVTGTGYDDTPASPGDLGGGAVASIGLGGALVDTPQLWRVNAWRDAHPQEFDGTVGPWINHEAKPVDFDVRSGNPNTNVSYGTSAVFAGALYMEDASFTTPYGNSGPGITNAETWEQQDNWYWEGYVQIPTPTQALSAFGDASLGIDLAAATDLNQIHYHYAMWCGNNDSRADGITFGVPPPTPELGTWALLLATGAIGGWARRRRKD